MGDVLWSPRDDALDVTHVGRFISWLGEHRGVEVRDHESLWQWSVTDLAGFWSAIWDFFEVTDHGRRTSVLPERVMPGAVWFPGSLLNYAEHALRGAGADDHTVAVHARSQARPDVQLTWGELRDQVARARRVLADLGVGPGDRVAGYLPNTPEALVAFLAAAGLGAVWASCAIEFGAPQRGRPLRTGGAGGPRRSRRLPLRPQGHRPAGRGRRRPRGPAERPARPGHRVRRLAPRRLAVVAGRARRRDRRPVRRAAGAVRPPARRPVLLRHHRQAQGDRARSRRHHPRAPEEPRAVLGPGPGRHVAVVLHDRLDDVERPGLGPHGRLCRRAGRRRSGLPRSRLAVEARGGDRRHDDGRQPRIRDGLPVPGDRRLPARSPGAHHRLGGSAAPARGLRVDRGAARAGRAAQRRQRRDRCLQRPGAEQPPAARAGRPDLGPGPRGRRARVRRGGPGGHRRAG